MDFLQEIEGLKTKELELAREKNDLKGKALDQVIELVAMFKFKPEEIFGLNENPEITPTPKAVKPNYQDLGFVIGETYTDGKKSYVFAEKGQRPIWLKKAIESGKTAKDLKGVKQGD